MLVSACGLKTEVALSVAAGFRMFADPPVWSRHVSETEPAICENAQTIHSAFPHVPHDKNPTCWLNAHFLSAGLATDEAPISELRPPGQQLILWAVRDR